MVASVEIISALIKRGDRLCDSGVMTPVRIAKNVKFKTLKGVHRLPETAITILATDMQIVKRRVCF
jgi:hypothetical protein